MLETSIRNGFLDANIDMKNNDGVDSRLCI
jgi:hypothetical protein